MLLAGGTLLLSGCGRDDPRKSKNQPQGADVNREALASFSNPRSIAGELVYVPIFSSAMHQSGNREYLLTATLRIHNIDLTESIALSAVSYFDTEGKLVREFLEESVVLPPLSTRQFVVPDKDRSGGTGANFLVKWEAEMRVSRPIIEALMISTSGQQGISFTTQGEVARELR
jgi:hypothetical protein